MHPDEPEKGRALTGSLFLALLPGAAERAAIATVAARLRKEAWLSREIAPARYHLTVHFLGRAPASGSLRPLLASVTRAADAAARAIAEVVPSIEVCLDHARTFITAGRSAHPVVLCGDAGEAGGLAALWRGTASALAAEGLVPRGPDHYVPHVTVGYDGRTMPPQPLIAIRWHARELVLVRSVAGRPHDTLGRWPLPLPAGG